jgi:hypothetical protein
VAQTENFIKQNLKKKKITFSFIFSFFLYFFKNKIIIFCFVFLYNFMKGIFVIGGTLILFGGL